jgi:hypothetical protein
MAVDRPEAIDPHPKGCNEVEGGQGEAFLFREEWARQRPGEENETGRCGRESETSAATSACGQTCHIEDAVGRPVGTSGHHGGLLPSSLLRDSGGEKARFGPTIRQSHNRPGVMHSAANARQRPPCWSLDPVMTGAARDPGPVASPSDRPAFTARFSQHNTGRRGFRHHLVHSNDDGHGKDPPKDEAGPEQQTSGRIGSGAARIKPPPRSRRSWAEDRAGRWLRVAPARRPRR